MTYIIAYVKTQKNKIHNQMRRHNLKIWLKYGTNFSDNSKTIDRIIVKFSVKT